MKRLQSEINAQVRDAERPEEERNRIFQNLITKNELYKSMARSLQEIGQLPDNCTYADLFEVNGVGSTTAEHETMKRERGLYEMAPYAVGKESQAFYEKFCKLVEDVIWKKVYSGQKINVGELVMYGDVREAEGIKDFLQDTYDEHDNLERMSD